jgi:hypothetical protein
MGTKWYQKNVVDGTEKVKVRTYRCPTHQTLLFRVRADIPVPTLEEEVLCPEGDMVKVPKYDEAQKIK